jgi:hypothetical protein
MTFKAIRYVLYFTVWLLLSVPVWAGIFFSMFL